MDDRTGRNGTELALYAERGEDAGARALQVHYQALWFSIVRAPWNSLVVVPAEAGDSAAGVATALADVGRRLRHMPVTFLVMAGPVDFASAGKFVSRVTAPRADAPAAPRVIVAVPPVVAEPLALAVTHAADAVVLCIRKGKTHRAAAARTIEMVGRERVLGCILS